MLTRLVYTHTISPGTDYFLNSVDLPRIKVIKDNIRSLLQRFFRSKSYVRCNNNATASDAEDTNDADGEAVSNTDRSDVVKDGGYAASSETKANQKTLAYIKYMHRFDKLNLCPDDKDVGVKTLMQFTRYPLRQFGEISASKFLEWMWAEKSMADMEDCLFYAEIMADDLKKADAQGKFSGADIAILVRLLRDLQDDVDDSQFITWMRSYQNTNGQAEVITSGEIVNRENELKNNILKFIQPSAFL